MKKFTVELHYDDRWRELAELKPDYEFVEQKNGKAGTIVNLGTANKDAEELAFEVADALSCIGDTRVLCNKTVIYDKIHKPPFRWLSLLGL